MGLFHWPSVLSSILTRYDSAKLCILSVLISIYPYLNLSICLSISISVYLSPLTVWLIHTNIQSTYYTSNWCLSPLILMRYKWVCISLILTSPTHNQSRFYMWLLYSKKKSEASFNHLCRLRNNENCQIMATSYIFYGSQTVFGCCFLFQNQRKC